MDNMSKVDTIVFDKTGTLTKGRAEVTNIKIIGNRSENDLLRMIAEAELISEHHLGKTIVKEVINRGLESEDVPEGEIIKGNGLRATVEGQDLVIGTRKLMLDSEILINEMIEGYTVTQDKKGNTAILASDEGEIVAIISIPDEIREDAFAALAEMRENGIKKRIM